MARKTTKNTEQTLREMLLKGIVHFAYRKKDGSLREAFGTLVPDIIDEKVSGMSLKHGKVQGEWRNYFDMEVGNWRRYSASQIVFIDTDYGE